MEQQIRPILMVAKPFFHLKIGLFQITVCLVVHSFDVKTGSPDPVYFAMARLLIQLAYCTVTAATCQ
jgi:hypothetical protein